MSRLSSEAAAAAAQMRMEISGGETKKVPVGPWPPPGSGVDSPRIPSSFRPSTLIAATSSRSSGTSPGDVPKPDR